VLDQGRLVAQRCLDRLLRRHVAEDHLIGRLAAPHRQHRHRFDLEAGAVEAQHRRLGRFGDVALAAQPGDARQHRGNRLGIDERRDHLADHLIGGLRPHPPQPGLVHVDQAPVLVDANRVRAVFEQPSVTLVGGLVTG
jgi:hypothetical protein